MGKDFELIAVRPDVHARLKDLAKAQGKRIIDIASGTLNQTAALFGVNPAAIEAAIFENWTAFNKANGFNGTDSDLADAYREGAKAFAVASGYPDLVDGIDRLNLEFHPSSLVGVFKKHGRPRRSVPPKKEISSSKTLA